MHWSDEYPHSIFASVLLLDGKIENWKVVNYPKKSPGDFSGYWKLDRLNDYTSEWKEFICNNDEEHHKAFTRWSAEWFRQWPLADDFMGGRPYELEPQRKGDYICPECGRTTKTKVRTTCRACYQKKRFSKMSPAKCHPDRKEHCAGLCRQCYRTGERARRAKCHPDRVDYRKGLCCPCYHKLPETLSKSVKRRRLRKYNLSDEQYSILLNQQKGKCIICGEIPTSIDHNHETGKVRGVLCLNCNLGLGNFKDDLDLLKNAVKYLEDHDNEKAI